MANARRRRTQRTDDEDFEILLADALPQLLAPGRIIPGAAWYFRIEGDFLVITRSTAQSNNDPGDG